MCFEARGKFRNQSMRKGYLQHLKKTVVAGDLPPLESVLVEIKTTQKILEKAGAYKT